MSDFYDRFSFRRIWPWLLLAVLIFFVAVQLFRVNAPQRVENLDEPGKPVYWTRGAVFSGPRIVPGGRFLAARIDLNKRSTLEGRFSVKNPKERINCLLLPADEFERWRTGQEYKRVAETGYVPSGRMSRELEPGGYYLILDNQSSTADREVAANFGVD